MRFSFMSGLIIFATACGLTVATVSCGGNGGSYTRMGDTTISTDTVWENMTVRMRGMLTIQSGSILTMRNVNLYFEPELDDTQTVTVNGGSLIADNCELHSGSGKQWNTEAYGNSTLSFTNTTATDHSGIRAYENTIINVNASEIEEIQCHDNATLNIQNGSGVYIVLFFEDSGTVNIASGALASGDNITRNISCKTSATTTGKVNISDSDVWGFQLDLVGLTDLTVDGGTGIVLAIHLTDVVKTVSTNITSDIAASGSIDFSSDGGPKFTYTGTQISYINTYINNTPGISSDVIFSGINKVVECNVWGDNSKLTFRSGTTLLADLAQAYESSTLTLDSVTLATDYSSPSITAEDNATIRITNVNAIPGTSVCAAGNGQVIITGGSDWGTNATFEELDSGMITY